MTWQMLAPEWRARLNQDAADPYQAYVTFVSMYSRIDADQVREADRPKYFEVAITFTPKGGNARPVTEHLTYGLRCEWWDSHLPVFDCDPDELTIFDGHPTSRTAAP